MKNKKNKITIAAAILLCIVAAISCTNNKGSANDVTPDVSFSKDIIPIFTSYCALNSNCHLGANSTNQNVNLDSADAYNTIIAKELISTSNPTSSLLYAEVEEDQMPLAPYNPLSAANTGLILDWIKQGAKNN